MKPGSLEARVLASRYCLSKQAEAAAKRVSREVEKI